MAFDPANEDDAKLLDAKIKEAIETAAEAHRAELAKLKSKNDELIGEKRKVNETNKSIMDKLGGRDLDSVIETLGVLEKDADARLIAEGKIDQVLQQRMEKRVAEFTGKITAKEKELETLQNTNKELTQQVERLVIDQEATNAFVAAGGLPEAVSDAVFRARQLFKLEDGKAVPRDDNGDIVSDAEGVLSIKRFMGSGDHLKGQARHLFGIPTGGGAGGSGQKGSGNNPWAKDTFNLTKQAEITRADPALAEKLKSQS